MGGTKMRIERLSSHQFEIFLTFDDLKERGFTKEDIWIDVDGVRNLFSDMMYEASDELGFELYGNLLIQVHLKQAQGMHVIVTQKSEDIELDGDILEMKVTLNESREMIFVFNDFEHIIEVSSYLLSISMTGGEVYYLDGAYFMLIEEDDLNKNNKEDVIAIMSEFSSSSIITSYRLKEYGKPIITSNAVKVIQSNFFKKR